MMYSYTTSLEGPSAFITKNRQRVRQYNNVVYLKNQDEFEVELFNPLQVTILAKIKINGKYVSASGLILKPGQRVFLERYLDSPKKFKFDTYVVDDSKEAAKAIELNGLLDVEFFLEQSTLGQISWVNNICTVPSWNPSGDCSWSSPTAIGENPYTFTCSSGGASSAINAAYNTTSTSFAGGTSNLNQPRRLVKKVSGTMETGRIEAGSASDQKFITENRTFNQYYSYHTSWKIQPESSKPYEIQDIKIYCTSCGTKIKKSSHKFCYNCGSSLS